MVPDPRLLGPEAALPRPGRLLAQVLGELGRLAPEPRGLQGLALELGVRGLEQLADLLVVDLEAARLDRVVVRDVAGGLDVERRREARQEARVLEALGRGLAMEQAEGLAAARLAVGDDTPVVPGLHRGDDGQPDLLEDLGLHQLSQRGLLEILEARSQ